MDDSPSSLKGRRPLAEMHGVNSNTKSPKLAELAVKPIKEVHSLGVLHTDPAERNMLWNEESGTVYLIDFERAVMQVRRKDKNEVNERCTLPNLGRKHKLAARNALREVQAE